MASQDVQGGGASQGQAFLREVWDTVRTAGAGLLLALALRILVFEPHTIPSSSMEPGLVTGDYIVVSKWPYGWGRASLPFNLPLIPAAHGGRLFGHDPARGEVVVFRLPRDPNEIYIKRLIGLPGDKIQIVRGEVYVNGRPNVRQFAGPGRDHDSPERPVTRVYETASNGKRYLTFGGAPDGDADNTDVYEVPQGTYFFMGDNRDNSLDSRWPQEVGVGFVPAANLIGRAEAIGWSWRPGASLFKPWTWLNLDASRFFRRIN
ncbi:MAG TPA: signal peptidase I [Phenylobacterium sp.]|uniref:signal peptidase I n=1 Tax=Phenylobacterium sp. TaxID=1871053 RepID=UPI002D42B49D|nr:signal peptidase I [Phenylobacterium sp.]HZZ68710.1 signal peptidase I [Phenylobacterium sp.]